MKLKVLKAIKKMLKNQLVLCSSTMRLQIVRQMLKKRQKSYVNKAVSIQNDWKKRTAIFSKPENRE